MTPSIPNITGKKGAGRKVVNPPLTVLNARRGTLDMREFPLVEMPRQDHIALTQKADRLAQTRPGGLRFAEPIDVDITPDNSGVWVDGVNAAGGSDRSIWRTRISSPRAHSLNFGFTSYHMPAGGRLRIAPLQNEEGSVEFTDADNEAHGQLWTPLVLADEVLIEVDIPKARRGELLLALRKVNHGFRDPLKIGANGSADCHLDVACSDHPVVGSLISEFADQIRSVGAFTLSGVDTCSGVLINNTLEDRKPYFLTAEHCGIAASNAASMVVYFNFQNSTCREPGTPANATSGDGLLSDFISGAILRAESAQSDFTLVELDDPIPLEYDPYFAGWDRSGMLPAMSVGIHHPNISEKRIAFDFDPLSPGSNGFVDVTNWEFGSTEPGSSGSPLFDENKHIVGQLYGGESTCGNRQSDIYGSFADSWIGNGTPETRLSDWLDPAGLAPLTLTGLTTKKSLNLSDATITEGQDGTRSITFTVDLLGRESDETVTVRYRTVNGSARENEDFVAAAGVLIFEAGKTNATLSVLVKGDTQPEEDETFFVILENPLNARIGVGSATGRIENDDFILPMITSPLMATAFKGDAFEYQIEAANTPSVFFITAMPTGMTVEPETGLVQWTPIDSGTYTVTLSAATPAGVTSETLTIVVRDTPLNEALDTSLAANSSGTAWFRQTATTFDGIDAAQSGPISDNEASSLELIVTTGDDPEALSFMWKVSSEEGFDQLSVAVNGETLDTISGEIDWTSNSVLLPADSQSTITWTYAKDEVESAGEDTAWVDQITTSFDDPAPRLFLNQTRVTTTLDGSFVFTPLANRSPTFSATGLPPGLDIDSASGAITGSPTSEGEFEVTITASNAAGSDEASFTISVLTPFLDAVELSDDDATGSTSGDATWFSQSDVTFDGMDALQSGSILDGQSTTFELVVDTGEQAQQLSFMLKVSSEEFFDGLTVFLNEEAVYGADGEFDWTEVTLDLPPFTENVIRWVYQKDEFESAGDDAAWVDQIQLTFASTAPSFTSEPGGLVLNPGAPVMVSFEAESAVGFFADGLPGGLSLDADTGLLTGAPTTLGDFPVTITATNAAGATELDLSILVVPPAVDAIDNQSPRITVDRVASTWFSQTNTTFDGIDALQSGPQSDRGFSVFEITLPPSPEAELLSFWWKISAEESSGSVRLLLNRTDVGFIAGEQDWTQEGILLPASQTNEILWVYANDEDDPNGTSAAWIDQLVLSSDEDGPVFLSGPNLSTALDQRFQYLVPVTNATTFSAVGLPDGLAIDTMGVITGVPTALGTFQATITAANDLGMAERQIDFTVAPPLAEATEAPVPSVTWIYNQDPTWFAQTNTSFDGVDAMRSAPISTGGDSSTLEFEVITSDGPHTLSFMANVTNGSPFEALLIDLNGSNLSTIPGNSTDGWREIIIPLEPLSTNRVRISFELLFSTAGEEAAFVDQIVLTSTPSTPPIVTAVTPAIVLPGAFVNIEGTNLHMVTNVQLAGENVLFSRIDTNRLTVLAPTDPGTYAFDLFNSLGTARTPTVDVEEGFADWIAARAPGNTSLQPTADADGDGVQNLLEYAFGGDPAAADPSVTRSQLLFQADGTRRLRFMRQRINLTYEVQSAPSIDNPLWTTRAINPGTAGEMVELLVDPAWESEDMFFLRVLVSE